MPWQLIYTSAPRLLTAGQTGFGTVARHRDIPALVVSAVERASQFARLPRMDAGRVVYSHRLVDAAGARHHVLSRVASAGADYTGRTNHLAHHVILTAAEAAELAAKGVSAADVIVRFPWRSSWDGGARWLEASETPDLAGLPPAQREQLSVWMEATGDALHANHLVAGAGARSGCIVIAPPKMEMRRLFAESLRAVPEQGWQFAFTTELDPGDSPGDFRWLGVSPESPVLDHVQTGRRLMLDLTRPHSLPVAEPLPEKPKAQAPQSPGKRTAPPRVAAPVGGEFVEPPIVAPPLVAELLGSMAAPPPPLNRRGKRKDAWGKDHEEGHGWRMGGFVALGVVAMLGMVLLLTGKWRKVGSWAQEQTRREASASPLPEPGSPVVGEPAPDPQASPVATSPPAPSAAAPVPSAPAPAAAKKKIVPWRAAHASQLADLALPELRLEQTHLLITSAGEERGPLLEARNNLSLSLKEKSPVLRLDYATRRATWIAAPGSAAAPPVQWRILQDNHEVLRVLIGDEGQGRPVDSTPVSATQDEEGIMGGEFGELLQRFNGQALWLRPPAQAAALLRECGYAGPAFVALRDMKADTGGLLNWLTAEQARMEAAANSPQIGQDVPAGATSPIESDFNTPRAAPRSKETNTLENRPPPTSSVAGSMEEAQMRVRAAARQRLDKLAELRGGGLMMGRFGPGTCGFFAGPADTAPADAVWIRDVVFAQP